MDKNVFAVGLVILVIGLFLSIGFWPIFGVSGSELAEDRDGLIYESYEDGDEVMVYGTLTNITFETAQLPDWVRDLMDELDVDDFVYVEIDEELELVVEDEDSIDFDEGDQVYGSLTLIKEEGIFIEREYWELDGNLSSKRILDILFYGTLGAGLAVTSVGFLKD